jgi:transmembrane sensor
MKLQRQIDRLLALRASEWHQVLEDADPAKRAEFISWLKQSPLHVKEYLEIVYTDRLLKQTDPERRLDVDELLQQLNGNVHTLASPSDSGGRSWPRVRQWRLALAAGVLLGLFLLGWQVTRDRLDSQTFDTQVGEQRTLRLADMSVITLNTDSDIKVRLDASTRNIELLRGEALFQVAHDPHHPFLVKTPSAIVQAVGTQFNVYEGPAATRVSVLEGRVRISSASDSQFFDAGEEGDVSPDGSIHRNTKANVLNTVAWRERRLVFTDSPLEEMVYEFNRYSPMVHLTLQGIAQDSFHYTGILDAADPDSLADLLSKEPDLKVERRGSEIVISHK